MKAITVRQPWASLIAAGVKTIETRPRRTACRGRIAIHAAAARPPVVDFGRWSVPPVEEVLCEWTERGGRPAVVTKVDLPLGAVVASAVLADCVPIIDRWGSTPDDGGWAIVVEDDGRLRHIGHGDISDQLPYGDFSSGRWALLLDDIKPTTERCPWCWGEGELDDTPQTPGRMAPRFQFVKDCPVCNGDTCCDPVTARGQQAVPWEWAL